jgi:hypothetical protein
VDGAAAEAARLQQLAVHVHDPRHAGSFVQVVDVLGAEVEFVPARGEPGLELGQGQVGGVGFDLLQVGAAGVVEGVHLARVAREALGRGHLAEVDPGPDPGRVAEGGQPALGRDPGAGQDEEAHVPDPL